MALRKVSDSSKPPAAVQDLPRLLYIEDEDLNWSVTELALKKHYYIERAANARAGFELASQGSFNLILMDIQLSGSDIDGIALTRLLTGKETQTKPSWAKDYAPAPNLAPIVFVTAYSARYSADQLMKAGAVDVVHKPVDFARLIVLITKLTLKGSIDGRAWTRRT